MPFKRLRKASDDTSKQLLSRGTDEDLLAVSAEPVSKKSKTSAAYEANAFDNAASVTTRTCAEDAQVAYQARHAAKQQTSSGPLPTLNLASGKQQPKADGRTFSRHPSVNQSQENSAAVLQSEGLESQEPQPGLSTVQSDSGGQSDEEENFEEREDDRANDPACIQCDDGGALASAVPCRLPIACAQVQCCPTKYFAASCLSCKLYQSFAYCYTLSFPPF